MSVKRIGEIAGKAALAGFAVAVLTAASAPAKAAVVTWDLWIAYDPAESNTPREWRTDHFVDDNPFGITTDTVFTGHVTFNDQGCGGFLCGPVEDPDFEIEIGFEGTGLSFSTGDDYRYNEHSNTYANPEARGPAMKFFLGFIQGVDFNAPFSHNSSVDNWAINLDNVVELYNLADVSGHPEWTVLRGTLCHNGYGEPGADSVCYRGDDQTVVPVPAALPLMGSGLATLGLAAWRRRRKV